MRDSLTIQWPGAATRFLALRLLPEDDLRGALADAFAAEPEQGGFVAACVGSLSRVVLRPAGRDTALEVTVPMEIVALSGTFSAEGPHLHIAVADPQGVVLGGHLLRGSTVRTTVELVLALCPAAFHRAEDARTGHAELFFG